MLRVYYETFIFFTWYSLSIVLDFGHRILPSSSPSVHVNTAAQDVKAGSDSDALEIENRESPQRIMITRLVLVTQASEANGSFFAIYQTNGGEQQQHCEYFHHERRFLPLPTNCTHVSKIERALDLRRKALFHALKFYQDVLTAANKPDLLIFTDLADYNFTPEINEILSKIEEVQQMSLDQVKHYTPNRLLHLITTATNDEHGNSNQKYFDLAMIQNAAEQLQKNKLENFKKILGIEKKYSLICP